jgi:hypothetical protein
MGSWMYKLDFFYRTIYSEIIKERIHSRKYKRTMDENNDVQEIDLQEIRSQEASPHEARHQEEPDASQEVCSAVASHQ